MRLVISVVDVVLESLPGVVTLVEVLLVECNLYN